MQQLLAFTKMLGILIMLLLVLSAYNRCKYDKKPVSRSNVLFYIVSFKVYFFVKPIVKSKIDDQEIFAIRANFFLRMFYLTIGLYFALLTAYAILKDV
jgi:hypothetical protein